MNNGAFGKPMENIENRVAVSSVTDRINALKLAVMPHYNRMTIFNENLVAE
jgi:hypothetical protein